MRNKQQYINTVLKITKEEVKNEFGKFSWAVAYRVKKLYPNAYMARRKNVCNSRINTQSLCRSRYDRSNS